VIQEQLMGRFTASDLWDMVQCSCDSRIFELVNGVVVEATPRGPLHSAVVIELRNRLRHHVQSRDLGRVVGSDTGFVLTTDPDTVRFSDVAFIVQARLSDPCPGPYLPLVPDFVAEVIAPVDRAEDLRGKVQMYLRGGTRLIWAIYPELQVIDIYRANRMGSVMHETGVLDGEDVLPGFVLPVRDLFASVYSE
jgi:Uma2 family endonuclease